jgi:hypothetical protein
MATEARPAFITITRRLEPETVAAVARFAASVRAASGERESHPIVVAAATLAGRAFGGDHEAWRPLVVAVRHLLSTTPARTAGEPRSRRELRAFVAENADLLEP